MERPIKLLFSGFFAGLSFFLCIIFYLATANKYSEGDGSNLDIWNTVLGVSFIIFCIVFIYQLWRFGVEVPEDPDEEEDDYAGI